LQEDAATVRHPIYGLFLGNLLTVGIAWVLQLHQPLQMSTNHTPDVDFLKEMGWLIVWGTALLYVDSLGIILRYEKLGDFFRRRVVLRFLISGFVLL
ncbi:GGDEF domain-containing protein, partial [Rhizobium ruizarguesonis]